MIDDGETNQRRQVTGAATLRFTRLTTVPTVPTGPSVYQQHFYSPVPVRAVLALPPSTAISTARSAEYDALTRHRPGELLTSIFFIVSIFSHHQLPPHIYPVLRA